MAVRDATPLRGEIWSVFTPGQPDDPHQPRPALVISEDIRNRSSDDVLVVPVFTRGSLGPTRVALKRGDGGLRRAGVLFCEEITALDVDFIARGPLGAPVSDAILDRAVRAVRRAIGEVLPEV